MEVPVLYIRLKDVKLETLNLKDELEPCLQILTLKIIYYYGIYSSQFVYGVFDIGLGYAAYILMAGGQKTSCSVLVTIRLNVGTTILTHVILALCMHLHACIPIA